MAVIHVVNIGKCVRGRESEEWWEKALAVDSKLFESPHKLAKW